MRNAGVMVTKLDKLNAAMRQLSLKASRQGSAVINNELIHVNANHVAIISRVMKI